APHLGDRNNTVNTVTRGYSVPHFTAWLGGDDGAAPRAVTEVTALGRIGRPQDIADAVALLASEESRWITGHVLDVTGGYFLGPRGGVIPV
ncbi:SDR family oxidoreductase, partial [Nonomuraea sp. NPDC003201]